MVSFMAAKQTIHMFIRLSSIDLGTQPARLLHSSNTESTHHAERDVYDGGNHVSSLHPGHFHRDRSVIADLWANALAVSLGNVHLHGRSKVGLDLERLRRIRECVSIPLVLHGATSVDDEAIRQAINGGIRKINFGSGLRSTFYRAVKDSIERHGAGFNPYEVLGSGTNVDVMMAGRLAVRDLVTSKMKVLGSLDRAPT